jgi:hypothetical protein
MLIAAFLFISSVSTFAQAPPPPPNNAGSATGPIGGQPSGAPIDGGIWIFMLFAGAYTAKKIQSSIKN